ncbi:MAG: LysM peptidoglycan-binding domain-containing protein [Alphaproteobacteria bacterium]|nr:LysM peptidoglycan-binding domain-containing protein [Alphaproteobacteria bacterium]
MSLQRASFTSLDEPWRVFPVQYNPTTLKGNWKPEWTPSTAIGSDVPLLEYARTSPRTLSMDLFFDTSTERALCSVRSRHLLPFEAFVRAEVLPQEGPNQKRRPHRLLFAWADQAFKGVVSSMETTTLMFSREGLPLRARVSVELTEHDPLRQRAIRSAAEERALCSWAPPAERFGQTSGGTLTQVAHQLGTTERQLLADNHIADPMHIPAGTTLVVR